MSNQLKTLDQSTQDLYLKSKLQLNTVFLKPELNAALKNDQTLRSQVFGAINIVHYIESNYQTENSTFDEYSKAITVYEPYKQVIYSFDDHDNLLDAINSLRVYLLNTYQTNTDELVDVYGNVLFIYTPTSTETDQVVVTDEVVYQTKPIEQDQDQEINQEQQNANFNQSTNNFDPTSFGFNPKIADDFKEMQINAVVNNIFMHKVMSNEVFIYNSKPKVIPILKILYIVMLGLMFIFSIVSFALINVFGKEMFTIATATTISGQTQTIVIPLARGATIPFDLIILLLVISWFIYGMIKGWKNDNIRYHFKFMVPLVFVIILVIVKLVGSFSGVFSFATDDILDSFNKIWNKHVEATNHPNAAAAGLRPIAPEDLESTKAHYQSIIMGYFATTIIVFAALLFALIVIVTAIFFNPKKDFERVKELHEQIRADLLAGKIDPSLYQIKPASARDSMWI